MYLIDIVYPDDENHRFLRIEYNCTFRFTDTTNLLHQSNIPALITLCARVNPSLSHHQRLTLRFRIGYELASDIIVGTSHQHSTELPDLRSPIKVAFCDCRSVPLNQHSNLSAGVRVALSYDLRAADCSVNFHERRSGTNESINTTHTCVRCVVSQIQCEAPPCLIIGHRF